MKQFFARIVAEWKLVILPALFKLGIWGVGAVALLDSSTIPVPMDAILAVYVWNDKGHFWLYCLMAAVGSAIGGLLPYGLGRAGGELFLLKRDQPRAIRAAARPISAAGVPGGHDSVDAAAADAVEGVCLCGRRV